MAYTKQTWADLPSKTTPINATRLGHIEDGIFSAAQTADTAASTADTAAANVGIVSGKVETLTERVNGLDTAVSNKVDKVAGKGLSTNDYDDTDKGKVDSLGTASTKNSTSVVTDSSDLVESGAVKEYVVDAVGWISGNLIPDTYVDGDTKTQNNVTFTKNGDTVNISINGTASGTAYFYINTSGLMPDLMSGENYVLNSGLINANIGLNYSDKLSGDSAWGNSVVSNGTDVSFSPRANIANQGLWIIVYSGTSGNYTLNPSIRHFTVDEQKCDNSVIAPVENGSTASQAYAVGSHAIRNGAFITWKNAKAQGETINDASDYTSGDVADSITNLESGKAYSYRYGYSSSADQTKTLNISADGKHSALIIASHSGGSEIAVFLATGNTAQPFTIKSDSNFIATTSNSRIVITSAFTNWILTIFSAGNVSVS